jgi:hypothetical protein
MGEASGFTVADADSSRVVTQEKTDEGIKKAFTIAA